MLESIDPDDIYDTPDEYRIDKDNPTKGIKDEDVLKLQLYRELRADKQIFSGPSDFSGNKKIVLVEDMDTNEILVKKILDVYDSEIYRYLKENPVSGMPRIKDIFEGSSQLIVLEEFIEGDTLEKLVKKSAFSYSDAINIIRGIGRVLH